MRISEAGNIGSGLGDAINGLGQEDALRADAEAAWSELDAETAPPPPAKAAPIVVAQPKAAVATPKTAVQAKKVNAAVASTKDRKKFIEDLRNVTDQILEFMVKSVAQQDRVGTVEYAMVKGYGAEIAAEAVRRYGQAKATAMMNSAYTKAQSASTAPTPTTVADPLTKNTQVNAPARPRTLSIKSESFMSKYGLWLGVGAVAVGGFFYMKRRRAA